MSFNKMSDLELCDYFAEKFRNIPDENWCVGYFSLDGSMSCALGHCDVRTGHLTSEGHALMDLFRLYLLSGVPEINDGYTIYIQETPKLRILSALADIRKKIISAG